MGKEAVFTVLHPVGGIRIVAAAALPERVERCGGDYAYTADGIKDCSNCLFPHRPESYDAIMRRFPELAELARKRE